MEQILEITLNIIYIVLSVLLAIALIYLIIDIYNDIRLDIRRNSIFSSRKKNSNKKLSDIKYSPTPSTSKGPTINGGNFHQIIIVGTERIADQQDCNLLKDWTWREEVDEDGIVRTIFTAKPKRPHQERTTTKETSFEKPR